MIPGKPQKRYWTANTVQGTVASMAPVYGPGAYVPFGYKYGRLRGMTKARAGVESAKWEGAARLAENIGGIIGAAAPLALFPRTRTFVMNAWKATRPAAEAALGESPTVVKKASVFAGRLGAASKNVLPDLKEPIRRAYQEGAGQRMGLRRIGFGSAKVVQKGVQAATSRQFWGKVRQHPLLPSVVGHQVVSWSGYAAPSIYARKKWKQANQRAENYWGGGRA